MCWHRVGEANPLFSVCIALWRPTALAKIYNVVGRQRNLGLHKAGLTPTTPVTSIAISPVKMSIGHKSLTNLRSGMIFLQGKPVFYIFLPSTPPYWQIILRFCWQWTPKWQKAKVGHVRHISAFRSFSGFIIALRNIPEKFRKKSLGNVIIYHTCQPSRD
jgi:hypothetical protein